MHASQPTSQELNSGWEFRALNAPDHPKVKDWHPAQVPGVVQTDLLTGKIIPDPFYGDNEARLQWIGLTDWEYRTTFQVDTALLQHEHVDLIFDGLDTFAEVFLNEQPALSADNMFRRWRIPAKPLLKLGPNTLRIVFHSPITFMIPKVKALSYILPSISTVNTGNEENVATAPYTRKALYQYGWDWGPRYVTIGIWEPVWLESWDSVRIATLHIHQLKITGDAAELAVEVEIQTDHSVTATVTISHNNAAGDSLTAAATQAVQLDSGGNRISIPVRISAPKLWYPAGYGAPDRYRFSASVKIGKAVVAAAEVKTGLRSVELRRIPDPWGKSFTLVVNGIPIFAKGANVIPFDSFPSRVQPERYRQILQAARDANMNMVREWGDGCRGAIASSSKNPFHPPTAIASGRIMSFSSTTSSRASWCNPPTPSLLAQFAQCQLRDPAQQSRQWRYALLGCLARAGAHRELHAAEPSLHVRVWFPVIPRGADNS
jgi:beta-mannosidase